MSDGPSRPQPRTAQNGETIYATPTYNSFGGNDGPSFVWTDSSGQIYDDSGAPTHQQQDRTLGGALADPSQLKPKAQLAGTAGYDQNGNPLLSKDVLQGLGGPNLSATQSNPDLYKMLQMHLAALSNQAYRPEIAAARTRALQSQLGAYGPMNQVLGGMLGQKNGQGAMDLQQLGQSPMDQAMFNIGRPNQNDIGLQKPPPTGPLQPNGQPGGGAVGIRRGPDGRLYDAQGNPLPMPGMPGTGQLGQ